MMETTIALCVVIAALLLDRFVSARQSQQERREWIAAQTDATRKAVRIAIARSGVDYERAEAVAEAIDRTMSNVHAERDPDLPPEGLG